MSALPLLEFIVSNLVEKPEEVKIQEIAGTQETVIEIRVAEKDVGKVIGKSGSVVKALRTLVNSIGLKEKKNYVLEIID